MATNSYNYTVGTSYNRFISLGFVATVCFKNYGKGLCLSVVDDVLVVLTKLILEL